jgi:MFS family permease
MTRDVVHNLRQRQAIVMLAAALGMSSADASTIGAVATQVRHAMGLSNTSIGVLVGASTGVATLMTLPAGLLVDRTRRVRLLAGAALVWGVLMVVSAMTTTFDFLLVVRLGLGAASAVAGPAVASLLGDSFPEAERGHIYGVVLAGELVGAGVGFAVAGELASISWRASFAVLGPPSWVLAWFLWRMHEPERGGTATAGVATGSQLSPTEAVSSWGRLGVARTIRYVLSIPTNLVLILTGACTYFFFDGIRTFGVEFVTGQYGVNQAVGTLMILLVGVGALFGVLVAGRLGDWVESHHHPAGRIIVAMAALGASVAAFIPGIVMRSALVAVPLLTTGAFGLAAANPPLDASRLQVVPPGLWGRAEGVRGVLRQVGDTSGPLAFGFAADHFFRGGRSGLEGSFLVMLFPLALGAAVLVLAVRTYPHDAEVARLDATREAPLGRGRSLGGR